MNSKKHIQWLSLLIVFLVFFGFGQSAWAATWYSQGAVQLNSITNWYSTPSGSGGSALGSWVSTDKYVVQGTHVLTFAAATFDTLFIESTGNHITAGVTVNGVVSVKASCSPTAGGALDINGTLIVTNGSALTPAGNITCNKLIISDATMTVATLTTLDLDGDLILEGTSALTAGDDAAVVTMTGTSAQTITVSEDSYCEFGDLTINNTGGVTTSSNFTMRDLLTTTAGAFTATAGNITFNPLAASNLWAATAAITFNDLVLNLGFDGTPATDATINGNLTKIGASAFAPTAGTITFTNTNLSGKEMQLVGGTTSFLHLEISAGSKLKTSSNFTIGDPATTATAGSLVVGSSASLICEAGTVTIVSAAATLTNNGTLEFNNLTNDVTAVATATNSSFVIKGDFYNTTSGIFTATAGTITFQNTTQRTITNQNNAQAELVFWGLTIASNSDVTCGENITISGDLTLGSAAELTFTAGATHLDVAGTININVASNANLEFEDVIIGATAATTVNTSSNFKVNGTAFTLTDSGADFFNASAGTVTFTDDCVLTAAANGDLIFYNVTVDGANADVTDAATPDFIQIKGNLTINGVGSTFANGSGSTTTFLGTSNSTISGSTDQSPAATFDVLVINKTGTTSNDNVYLTINVAIANTATSTITLTDGILDLGSKTLTVGAQVLPTQTSGAINGATGTYSVAATHADGLTDALFTINGTPTLYNFIVGDAVSLGAGNLTINGNLTLNASLTILSARTVTLYGNLTQSGAAFDIVGNADGTSVLKLKGSGSCATLADALFTNQPSLIFERGEVLTGSLTMIASNTLTINTSTQYLDLSSYTLTLNNTTVLNRASGGIDADNGVVVLGTSHTTIPANLFKNNIVKDLTIVAPTTLGGDLTINGTLSGVFMVTTNNNTLTFGPNAGALPFTAAAHVVGNLKRTVTNSPTVFPIGNGTATTGYSPVSIQFAKAGSSQVVTVSSNTINPVYSRGGDPTRAILGLWTITPEGTAPVDTVAIDFGWGNDLKNGLAVDVNTFPARWNTSSWVDYRNGYATASSTNLTATSEISPKTSNFPINASALSGEWAVFVPASSSETDKNAAINVTNNKLVIKNVTPTKVEAGIPFSVTVELQDQYGNAVVTNNALTLAFANVIGSVTGIGTIAGVIPVGSSSVIVNGFSYATASAGNQFKVTGSGPSSLPNAGLSPLINVIDVLPSDQINTIVLGGGTTSTSMTFTLATGKGIVLAKAGSPITSADYPVDGVTYFASTNFGEGSKIGDAVVVYKGAGSNTVTISGLAPKTTYYFRGFSYGTTTIAGTEKYLTFASALNPVNFLTGGSATYDDDTDFGTNNTMATAKPIGANSPIKGTIKTTDDVDWFSFTITNSAPNLRARLTLSAALGNYNVELYNVDGRRLRRGTRLTNNNENQVINELEPGTYLVKVVGVDGAFDPTNYYTLQLTTDGSEIYSVTE